MKHIAVIINPIAGNGAGKKIWQALEPGLKALFEKITHRMSNVSDDISGLTRDLLSERPDYLVIIGGDGTLSQAINGIIVADQLPYPELKTAYFNCGCGGDFGRQFPSQHITEFLERLVHNQTISTNVGKITFSDKISYFINIASCGVSADVVVSASKTPWLKRVGGGMYYFIHGFKTLLSLKPLDVRIAYDNHPAEEAKMSMIALCNGQFFGGRMHVAPMARLDDDLLDVVMFLDATPLRALLKFRKIYSGRHLRESKVHYRQAKTVLIETLGKPVPVEADGEMLGYLPARFELIPMQLQLII
ncbi:YegS/Rv2252/BmrU family lipid kinase [Legionella sp. MW5194]|uniref:diacylglycerol/lipid kinase family protein n=1 Tax=Legionella sp. MW5194 TaxID=2662448 RepID=UPI00193D69EC|nr:diacylglycerol kinase family protein [Legionella sp. MW5194]QRN03169.1 YegS/Rv2252/BmrU family lipid kinase [Legionella sp. MW5194]